MAEPSTIQTVVDKNYEEFQKLLPSLMKTHAGKYAVMREGEAIEFFDTSRDALIFGHKEYPDGLFSIQQVTNVVVDLGYFSHALHHDQV